MERLRVRVYNVRFGDAILISVPERTAEGESKTRHILIDVGNVIQGEGGMDSIFGPVVENVLSVLNGQPLDLYVMTHEHMDHVQGLLYASQRLGYQLDVDYAWITASAAPDYYETHENARKRRRLAEEVYNLVETFLAASPDQGPLFQVLMANNNPNRSAECVAYLRSLAKHPAYIHRESTLEGTHPFQEARLQVWAPEEDTSEYYGAFRPMALGVAGAGGAGREATLLRLVPPSGVDAGAFYNLVAKRRGGLADNLLAIDRAANNTSIVFSLEWRGWRLLFPGDAEIRSWKTMDRENQLKEVHFLKVSHHGSINGTPVDLVDKILPERPTDERRYAVVSTYPDVYSGIPDPQPERLLRQRGEWHSVEEVEDGSYLDFEFDEQGGSRVVPGAPRLAAGDGAGGLALALGAAAATIEIDKLHVINLSRNGTFAASGGFATTPADVDAIFEHLAANRIQRLALYFHGGLVDEQAALSAAQALLPQYQSVQNGHTVFFAWESGWLETIRHNLDRIAGDAIFQRILDVVERFVLSKVGERLGVAGLGLAGAPAANGEAGIEPVSAEEAAELEAHLLEDQEFQAAVDDLVADLEAEAGAGGLALDAGTTTESRTLLSQDVISRMQEPAQAPAFALDFTAPILVLTGGAVNVFRRVVNRLRGKTDHGVHATVVEEILRELYVDNVGGGLWRLMKEQARRAFEPNEGLDGANLHGGTYFLERLRDYWNDPAHERLHVALIGHSAGAIYIARLLEKADEIMPPDFKFSQIIYLAPGVNFELFKSAVVDRSSRFRTFRMFTMRDELERQDVLVPVLYPHSLLYLVSGLLEGDEEEPLVGMEKFYLPGSPYTDEIAQAVRTFVLAPGERRVVWAIAAEEPGFASGARKHGGFGADASTLSSILHWLGV